MSKSLLYKEIIGGREYYIYLPIDIAVDALNTNIKFKRMTLIPDEGNPPYPDSIGFRIDKTPIRFFTYNNFNDSGMNELDNNFRNAINDYVRMKFGEKGREWEVTFKLIFENLITYESRKPYLSMLEKIEI